MTAVAERAAEGWLLRTGSRAATSGEIAYLSRIALGAATGLIAMPALLSAFVSPAVAIPVGVALVSSAFLIGAVGGIAWLRGSPDEPAAKATETDQALDIASVCAGAVLFLDPQGSVTGFSGRDRDTFLGWMRDPQGRGFYDQLHVSDRLDFMRAVDSLRQGARDVSVDLRIERAAPLGPAVAEQFVHIRLDMTALAQDGDGALSAIFGQMRDVSDEQALKSDAARKAAEAESANDAKSRFLAAVSHELRTPLNAILGFSDILIGEYFGRLENDRQREYVRLIRQSGAHLLSVVNTMLDMSKIEAGRYELMMEPFAIADSVRACEEMLALQAREKGVTLTSRVQRGLGEITADQRAIQQILINLVGNAVKFTEDGGVVTIDAAARDGELTLAVSDTGIGIAESQLAQIGRPFMQVQNEYTRRYEGTGLGLSLVKGLVALHGGRFSIASRPGEGTVITVTVPMDGSGAVTAEADILDIEAQRPVEFPPRLKNAAPFADSRHGERDHGQATAKIA
ncbi:MAG: two-component sensor histidine kinase [Rhizobiales bacterium 63-7]|nr:HAMP domain-containing histidine kinase [Hyphomicrobiales bacterium]OJU72341.1 MAG: two-component sensor histidine kinase [Rhizobiales bacterium 63-7]